MTGRELTCVQTSCTTKGDDSNRFILGLGKRLQAVNGLVANGQAHSSIMQVLIKQG